jgi:hypothetical protein
MLDILRKPKESARDRLLFRFPVPKPGTGIKNSLTGTQTTDDVV